MIDLLRARLRQGTRTTSYPKGPVRLPERYRGRPAVDAARCGAAGADACRACADACPTSAIELAPLRIDLGKCVFCGACEEACSQTPHAGALRLTGDHQLAARRREELVVGGPEERLATALDAAARRLFGRSLKLRQVSAGGCNACEADLNVLATVGWDLGRFGIQFVASPRHADGIVVTGPVTTNMELALRETYAAVPAPKIVVALGACAISGGVFGGADAARGGVPADIPVDLFVPGCPPHPFTILDGLLRLLGRIESKTL